MPYGARRPLRQMALICGLIAVTGQALAADIRIAALGDSLTQGYGLIEKDGLVPQLQRWLIAQGITDAVLINAGVSGDTTAGGRARIGWTLGSETDGLILALGANDMLRGIDPEVSKGNLAAILTAAGAAGVPVLLVGMQSAGNYGPAYKEAFDGMYPALSAEFGTLLFPSLLQPLAREG